MSEVGFLEKDHRILALEPEGMEKAHQGFMSSGSSGRAVLETPVPENHVGADHPLSEVVIEGNLRDLKKGEEMKPVSEEAFGKAPQASVTVFPAGPEEEAFFEEFDPPLVGPGRKLRANLFQSQGIPEDSFQDSVVFPKGLGLIFEIKGAHFSQEMDKTLLLLSGKPGIGRIEIGHKHTPIVFGEDRFGNLGAPGLCNLVISEPFVDHGPEPMVGSAYLPPGFIHVKVRALTNRLENLLHLDPKPLTHPLEGLGESPFRDLEMSECLKELLDLIERKSVVILQDHGLNEDIGTQIPVRDFSSGIRGGHHLLTMGTIVTMLPETGDLRTGGNEIFLQVFNHLLRGAQSVMAIRAASESLLNHPVNRLGLHSGQALVPGFLPRGLGAFQALGKPEGLQEFLSGFRLFFRSQCLFELFVFLVQLEELLNEFFPGLPELEDLFDQFFFRFLGEEELAVSFHTPNNGQRGDFFEGIASGG